MQKKGASDSDPRGSRDFQNLHYFFKSINLQNKQKFFNWRMSKTAELERELAELHAKYKASEGEKDSIQIIKKQRATIDKWVCLACSIIIMFELK